jgi:hypothetical protein
VIEGLFHLVTVNIKKQMRVTISSLLSWQTPTWSTHEIRILPPIDPCPCQPTSINAVILSAVALKITAKLILSPFPLRSSAKGGRGVGFEGAIASKYQDAIALPRQLPES